MYEWQGKEWLEAANLVNRRDPRRYSVGYSSHDDSEFGAGVCVWFASTDEMAAFLNEIEPLGYQLAETELAALRSKMAPLLAELGAAGPNEDLRQALNEASVGAWQLDWWGEFRELLEADKGWAVEARQMFRSEDDDLGPIREEELEAFIEYLSAWRT